MYLPHLGGGVGKSALTCQFVYNVLCVSSGRIALSMAAIDVPINTVSKAMIQVSTDCLPQFKPGKKVYSGISRP